VFHLKKNFGDRSNARRTFQVSDIGFNSPFIVQQETAEWRRPVIESEGVTREYPRIAGTSSFLLWMQRRHQISVFHLKKNFGDRSNARRTFQVSDIGYLEAHGTGTSLGDPIEIAGLTKAFRRYTDANQWMQRRHQISVFHLKKNFGDRSNARRTFQVSDIGFAAFKAAEPGNWFWNFSFYRAAGNGGMETAGHRTAALSRCPILDLTEPMEQNWFASV
jgi:hypothetical protein